MVRKFYNVDAPETATGSPSVAQLMAQHGVKNETELMVAAPIEPLEQKEEPQKPAEVTPVETTTEPQTVETANLETPSPASEPPKVEEPQKVELPKAEPSWQEVLKNQQPDTVLKELGFDAESVGFLKEYKELDPKMKAFLNLWKSGGDIQGYLQEMTTDYSKLSAEEVMRHQLRQEYPKASKQQLDVLFEEEVIERYKLDDSRFSESEVERGKLLLEAKADKYRDALLSSQSEKLLPKPPEPKAAEPDNSAELAKQQFDAYKSQVLNDNYTKDIFAKSSFTFGEGADKFNFPVNPNDLSDMLFTDKWQENMFDKNNNPNVEHHMLVATVNKYGVKFIQALAQHFKSLGGEKAVESIENATKPEASSPSPTQAAPSTPAEAMAKGGRLIN